MKKAALAAVVAVFALLAFAVYSGKAVGYSVWNGHRNLLRLVIALGAPVDREYIDAYTPLGVATEFGDTDSMRILIAAGASPNNSEFGPSPIRQAVHMRSIDVMQVLLEGGGDANATSPPIARSLLIIAAVGGDAAKVRLLLRHGAYLFYRDAEGHDAYTLVTKAPDELPSDGWSVRPDFRNQEIAHILKAEIEKRK